MIAFVTDGSMVEREFTEVECLKGGMLNKADEFE
jgi:hypothetical protein